MTKIGILALQGAFAEHEQVLKALGVETVQIRNRQDWDISKISASWKNQSETGDSFALHGL